MAKMKRRLTKKELNDYYKIEELIQSTKQQDSQKNKPELIEKVKEAQQVKKETSQKQILRYGGREIDVNQIFLTDHGYKRSVERMGLKQIERNKVNKHIRKLLLQSIYIGRITATDGNETDMFVYNKYSIHVSPIDYGVTTILEYDKMKYNPAQKKINSLIWKEFRKLDKKERARIKQLKLHSLEIESEISQLKLRAFKTKSDAVKFSCKGRIAALQLHIQQSKNEIEQIKTDKRQIAYTLATVI